MSMLSELREFLYLSKMHRHKLDIEKDNATMLRLIYLKMYNRMKFKNVTLKTVPQKSIACVFKQFMFETCQLICENSGKVNLYFHWQLDYTITETSGEAILNIVVKLLRFGTCS